MEITIDVNEIKKHPNTMRYIENGYYAVINKEGVLSVYKEK